jgi:hypothetical protein
VDAHEAPAAILPLDSVSPISPVCLRSLLPSVLRKRDVQPTTSAQNTNDAHVDQSPRSQNDESTTQDAPTPLLDKPCLLPSVIRRATSPTVTEKATCTSPDVSRISQRHVHFEPDLHDKNQSPLCQDQVAPTETHARDHAQQTTQFPSAPSSPKATYCLRRARLPTARQRRRLLRARTWPSRLDEEDDD